MVNIRNEDFLMSVISYKNYAYLKGPKGDRGPKGDKGDRGPAGDSGIVSSTGRILYDAGSKTISFNADGLATESYVNTAIGNLIDSAPSLLNTLNELAAALGNNPNFAASVVLKTGSTMTGFLTLHNDPTNALHAATKQYVDNVASSATGALVTDDIPEGSTNLYYTDIRARAAISATGSLNYNSSTGVISYIAPVLATVATSGSYNDLLNKPTNVSAFANDSGYLTTVSWTEVTGKPTLAAIATTGSYNDLLNKPTNVSVFANDSGYLTTVSWAEVTGKPTLAAIATTGSYNDLTDIPADLISESSTIDGGTF